MKAPTSSVRFSEAQELLDYGFSNYQYKILGEQGTVIQSATVDKGVNSAVNLVLENDIGVLVEKGEESNIEQTININEDLVAPLYEGEKVGEIVYTLDGEEIGKVNIVCEKGIEKKTFFSMATYVYKTYFPLLRI